MPSPDPQSPKIKSPLLEVESGRCLLCGAPPNFNGATFFAMHAGQSVCVCARHFPPLVLLTPERQRQAMVQIVDEAFMLQGRSPKKRAPSSPPRRRLAGARPQQEPSRCGLLLRIVARVPMLPELIGALIGAVLWLIVTGGAP